MEVGPGPVEEPPRKRLRHEDHEVRDSFRFGETHSTSALERPRGTVAAREKRGFGQGSRRFVRLYPRAG